MRVDVTLTTYELMWAGLVGIMRRISSMKEKMDTDRHAPKSSWATDIDAAAAEMAVSKHLGVYYSGHVRNYNGDDVLGGWQVRCTIYDSGHLVVRADDKDDRLFILVVAKAPTYSIRGMFRASDAKAGGQDSPYYRPCDPDEGSPAWWVPQSDLIDIRR